MKAKSVPALVTLSAGLVDCIISIYYHLDLFTYLKQLLIVLLLFYVIGCIIQMILDIGMQKMKDSEEVPEEPKDNIEIAESTDDKLENQQVE